MPYTNIDKALLFLRNQLFWRKFENFDELKLSYSSIFVAETSHMFSTYHLPFLFYLDLELLAKNKKDLVSTHSFFILLLITQDLNKIKKIPHTLL